MTRYLDIHAVGKLVQSVGIEKCLVDLADYIGQDFRRWNEFAKSSRFAAHAPTGVLELMPIYDKTRFAFKCVNGHPINPTKGLMTVVAFGAFSDMENGYPLLLSEMTVTTALRTAATSALAAKALARKNSRSMAVIGCGAQSEFQILAFKAIMGIQEFRLFDTDPAAIAKVRRNLSGHDGIMLIDAASAHEAVKGADIVTTVTADKAKATILTPGMIEPGMHINGVGGDCPGKTELHPDVLRGARVIVEYEPQARIEGDIQQMPATFPVIELWKVLTGAEAGRQNDAQITVFDSVGFALQDFSSLRYLHDVAAQKNIGGFIDLVPSLSDPKDLFSLLQAMPLPVPPMKTNATVERKC